MVRIYYLLAVVVGTLLVCAPGFAGRAAFAQDAAPGDRLAEWNGLSEQERELLRASLKTLKQMSPDDRERVLENYNKFKLFPQEQQSKIIENYNRYMSMDAMQRKVVRERYKKWSKMSPDQQNLLNNRYQKLMNMRPEDQAKFFQNYDVWQRLTSEQKDKLFSQWNLLSEAQKKLLLQNQHSTKSLQQKRDEFKAIMQNLNKQKNIPRRTLNSKTGGGAAGSQ